MACGPPPSRATGGLLRVPVPSYACLLPPQPWDESLLDEDSLGREGCAFPEDGSGCQFLPWWLWDTGFVDEHLLSLQNSTCSRRTPGKSVLKRRQGPCGLVFCGGKLRYGARQSWVSWPRNMLRPPSLRHITDRTCVGKDVLGFGWGSAQGTSILPLGSPQCAVSGCRRLSCARRLARGGSELCPGSCWDTWGRQTLCLAWSRTHLATKCCSGHPKSLASQTLHFQAVPGRWLLTGPWELPLFSQRCREKKSLVSFYFSEGETERAAKVEAFPREL